MKVRQGAKQELLISIPVGIRAVVPLKAGDKVMMTARGGQITIEPEIARTAVKAREDRRKKNET